MDDIREAKPLTIKRRGDDGKRLIRCAFRRNCDRKYFNNRVAAYNWI